MIHVVSVFMLYIIAECIVLMFIVFVGYKHCYKCFMLNNFI